MVIFDEEEKETETVIRLRLLPDGPFGSILLAEVDGDGEMVSAGRIATISASGMYLARGYCGHIAANHVGRIELLAGAEEHEQ
jgi:hypothetical protein